MKTVAEQEWAPLPCGCAPWNRVWCAEGAELRDEIAEKAAAELKARRIYADARRAYGGHIEPEATE